MPGIDRERRLALLKDNLAQRTAALDQKQTELDSNRHMFSEEELWGMQATLDVLRFEIEMDRLSLNAQISRLSKE
jgi:hypothetical protein